MEINMYDDNLNFELFSQNCIDGEEIPNIQKLKNTVYQLVSTLGWETLVAEWMKYLKHEVHDRKTAFNFATWLFIYDFGKCNISNPYPFLALLFKKMELDKDIQDDLNNRFDTPYDRFLDLYVDVLISSKVIDVSEADFLIPDKDTMLLDELKKL